MEKVVRIFTDGSAIGNPGAGGWGAVLIQGTRRREIFGGRPWTTISEMELVAAIEALRTVPPGTRVELKSDSELLIRGMRHLVYRWQHQGWKNRNGRNVQHRALWMELVELNNQLNIQWSWVRGHSKHPIQTRADALAYGAARSAWSLQRAA